MKQQSRKEDEIFQDEVDKRMKIKNGEFETIGGKKKCEKCPKQKKGSRECGTQLLVGSRSRGGGGSDGCGDEGRRKSKRKRSSKMLTKPGSRVVGR